MTTRHPFLAAAVAVLLTVCSGATIAQPASSRFIRVAELQIHPAQLEAFAAATREVGQASVNLEEGCLALYAVADKDNPAFVRVFEVYRDPAAYQAHLQTPHFKKFRDSTNPMVTSRKLMDATPISLATKPGATP
jgi:quinol monooxygenase YgiN